MELKEVGYKLLTTQQETNRLLRLIAKRLDKHEQELRTIRRRIATTSVPIYAETDEVSYDEVMQTLGNLIRPGYENVIVQGEVKSVGHEDGESVSRYPMPDNAWVVIYTTGNDIDRMYYEDKHGERTLVTVDDEGNVIPVAGDEYGN